MIRRLSLLFISFTLLGCPLVEENKAYNVDKPKNITWEEGFFSINIKWEESKAQYYRLYLKSNNSWDLIEDFIPANSHRVLDFKFDKDLNFGISAYYKGSESGISPIKTININKSDLFLEDIYIESLAYSDGIGVSLSDLPGSFKYHIYRDGAYLNTTLGTTYKDLNVEKGRIYNYSISWENLITGDVGPKSPVYPGIYSDILDPFENQNKRLLETNLNGFIYQYNTLLDKDTYLVPVAKERTSYISISAPVGYGKCRLYHDSNLIKELTLPVRDLEIANKSPEDKIYTLEVTSIDRGENYIKGYRLDIREGAISPPGNLRVDIINNVVNLSWDSSLKCAVYRRKAQGDWELLKIDVVSSFSDRSLVVGEGYYYGISAISGGLESKLLESSLVSTPKDSVFVTGIEVKSLYSTNSIFLNWNELDDSYEYQIYRSSSKLELGTKVGTTTNLTFRDNSSPALIKDSLYYYRVIWRDPVHRIEGSVPAYGHPGIYSDITDTREPTDNLREEIYSDSFSPGEAIDAVLYKKDDFIDRDWFRYTVPGLTSSYLTGSGLDGQALVNIYSGETIVSSGEFNFLDIELKNPGIGDRTFFIEVLPTSESSEFVESYTLKISDF